MLENETRVRMGAKQLANGSVQFDLTAEAPTVEKAKELLGEAIEALIETVKLKGLEMAKK